MVKIDLTDTHYLYYCLMDMEIDRLVGFVIQNIQKFKIFKKFKIEKNSKLTSELKNFKKLKILK